MHLKSLYLCISIYFCLCITDAKADTFLLKPEWSGPCQQTDTVDVNRGHAPEVFVRAAYCQVTGEEPDQALVNTIAYDLKNNPRARRIDVVRQFCVDADRECSLAYSNPWINNPSITAPVCAKKSQRNIGALMMMFFDCPGLTNCKMNWANTHSIGMETRDVQLGWGEKKDGYYKADHLGFWKYEFKNFVAAGLQFILPNVYGPDMSDEGRIDTLAQALEELNPSIKIGLFDDTTSWAKWWATGVWKTPPSLDNVEEAATILYQAKWLPFFNKIPKKFWYRIHGRPVIYFYNSGTLQPIKKASPVVKRMKQLFMDDFGIEPFVVVDSAFFYERQMPNVADSEFVFNTIHPSPLYSPIANLGDGTNITPTINLTDGVGISTMGGISIATAMTKWDYIGRDKPNTILTDEDIIIKGPERLKRVLSKSRGAKSLLLETWNDLGEGTNLDPNYDYYYLGKWLPPDTFMKIIRHENCKN